MPIEPLLLCGTAKGVGDVVPTSQPKPQPAISLGLQALLDWNHILKAKRNALSSEDGNYFESVGRELRIDPPTIFCRPCRDLLKSPPEPGKGNGGFGVKGLDWVPFHRDIFDLIDCCHNPRGNCPLCQQFWKSIKNTTTGFRVEKKVFRLGIHRQGLEVCLEAPDFDWPFDLTLNLPVRINEVDHYPVRVSFNSYDDQERHNSKLGLPIENCTDSNTTFSRVENWMQECGEKHAQCKINHDLFPSNPPARLICIDSFGKRFRLEESRRPEGQDGSQNASGGYLRPPEYTALSYRWGTRASFMLSKHNLEDMREWLSVSLLPKTLRDACAITVRLRLRHIWIDRLCIIQDSEKDWECESSKMADVYRNAWCTISATGSRDDNGGCYFHRNPLEILPLKLASNPFVDGPFCLGTSSYFDTDDNRMIYNYLGDRAWTFQERNLSRRILHFAKNQVYWRCRERNACETSPSFSTYTSTETFPLSEIKSEYDALVRWTEIVEAYSWGRLSKKKDKLPALSGMAAEMQLASRDTYLAGLWRKHIVLSLCWTVESQNPERPKLYRAPSWSWASLDSVIGHRALPFEPENYDSITELREMATIEDVRVTLSSCNNPYGRVDSGWIEISSHFFRLSFAFVNRRSNEYFTRMRANGEQVEQMDVSLEFFDHDHHLTGGWATPLFCLVLVYDDWRKILYCLIVTPHSNTPCQRPELEANLPHSNTNTRYQRVGLTELRFKSNGCHDFLQRCAKQTIVIL